MLTPQEVSEHVFSKASFGGYNMSMVDEFLDVLTGDYTALYNENAVLKSKMKVLVDKVEEYRSTEEAMRKALMTAQRMADDLIKEAEQTKTEILRQAEQDAAGAMDRIHKELADEEYRLTVAKNATAAYVLKAKKLYEEQIGFLDGLEQVSAPVSKTDQEHAVAATVQDIEDNMQRLLAQQDDAADTQEQTEITVHEPTQEFYVEESPEPAGEAPAVPEGEPSDMEKTAEFRAEFDFGALQFGKDYEIR